jgi:hypothetical protein
MLKPRSYHVRLQFVSLLCFGAGFVCRVALGRQDIAFSYPYSVLFQSCWYAAGLVLFMLAILGEQSWKKGCLGLGIWMLLGVASIVAILLSVPK